MIKEYKAGKHVCLYYESKDGYYGKCGHVQHQTNYCPYCGIRVAVVEGISWEEYCQGNGKKKEYLWDIETRNWVQV